MRHFQSIYSILALTAILLFTFHASAGEYDVLTEGWNEGYIVNGVERSFYLDLPENVEEGGPWPVVFNWHGFGDTASNMRQMVQFLVDNPMMPFIGVTPEDSEMLYDWDLLDGVNPENREMLLFDALLEDIDSTWGVDWNHVHTMGFSFGGTVSNMLGVLRGDVIASQANWSSVYGSNPMNIIPYMMMWWPELPPEYRYVELRVHGGILDWMMLPFGQYGTNDRKYLNANGHDVIGCKHSLPHNMGAVFMGPEHFIRFFADHPRGLFDSPYAEDMPSEYPSSCECDEHPGVSVAITPDDPPVEVSPGGEFTYSMRLTNNLDVRTTFDIWIMVDVPVYGLYGPVELTEGIALGAGQEVVEQAISQRVPGFAPPGNYTYIACSGEYPDDIRDTGSFEFTVIPELP